MFGPRQSLPSTSPCVAFYSTPGTVLTWSGHCPPRHPRGRFSHEGQVTGHAPVVRSADRLTWSGQRTGSHGQVSGQAHMIRSADTLTWSGQRTGSHDQVSGHAHVVRLPDTLTWSRLVGVPGRLDSHALRPVSSTSPHQARAAS